MKFRVLGAASIAAALMGCARIPFSSPQLSVGEPVKRAELRSLGAMIADAETKGLHIVYVHGMREAKPERPPRTLTQLFGNLGRQRRLLLSEHIFL